jgi:hypothetical protein
MLCLFAIIAMINCNMFPGGYTKTDINSNDARINEVLMLVNSQIESFLNDGRFYPIACNLVLN